MNRVILIGNVGKMSDIKQVNQTSILNFSLATREGDKSVWHNCTVFNKTADLVKGYVQVGDKIAIEGKLNYREYEKDGVKHTVADIVVGSIEFLKPKNKEPQQAPAPTPTQPNQAPTFVDNSDLPF